MNLTDAQGSIGALLRLSDADVVELRLLDREGVELYYPGYEPLLWPKEADELRFAPHSGEPVEWGYVAVFVNGAELFRFSPGTGYQIFSLRPGCVPAVSDLIAMRARPFTLVQ